MPGPITHQFRVPDKRPPAVVSLAFAALVLSPLAILLLGLPMLGINLTAVPRGPSALFTLLFFGVVVAVALVLVAYWLALNMFQTLQLLVPLLVAGAFTGQHAMRARARQGLKRD